jgi:uncharacterized protein with HEPN domain
MDRDETTLVEIRDAARSLLRIAAGSDRDRLAEDQLTRYAILFAIIVMGEAVKRLSDGFRADHPDIPWGRICGMRDRVVHAYDRVDLDIVWSVATSHAPALISALDVLIPPESIP